MILPFRKSTGQKRLSALIKEGVGIREARWPTPDVIDDTSRGVVAESILQWVWNAMGEMRRPYGIDHVAVALACRDTAGRVVCSNSLGVVKPGVFYTPDGMARIEAFLDDVSEVPAHSRVEIVGALLSLGDVAYELELRKAA